MIIEPHRHEGLANIISQQVFLLLAAKKIS